jgi:hypothetical protein
LKKFDQQIFLFSTKCLWRQARAAALIFTGYSST